MPQTEEQKIRSRLRTYERKLQKEKKEYGFYRDGAGKAREIATDLAIRLMRKQQG